MKVKGCDAVISRFSLAEICAVFVRHLRHNLLCLSSSWPILFYPVDMSKMVLVIPHCMIVHRLAVIVACKCIALCLGAGGADVSNPGLRHVCPLLQPLPSSDSRRTHLPG